MGLGNTFPGYLDSSSRDHGHIEKSGLITPGVEDFKISKAKKLESIKEKKSSKGRSKSESKDLNSSED